MTLKQQMGLVLVAGDLQHVGELGLVLLGLKGPPHPTPALPSQADRSHQAQSDTTHDQPRGRAAAGRGLLPSRLSASTRSAVMSRPIWSARGW